MLDTMGPCSQGIPPRLAAAAPPRTATPARAPPCARGAAPARARVRHASVPARECPWYVRECVCVRARACVGECVLPHLVLQPCELGRLDLRPRRVRVSVRVSVRERSCARVSMSVRVSVHTSARCWSCVHPTDSRARTFPHPSVRKCSRAFVPFGCFACPCVHFGVLGVCMRCLPRRCVRAGCVCARACVRVRYARARVCVPVQARMRRPAPAVTSTRARSPLA
jgi:hypothetical protein